MVGLLVAGVASKLVIVGVLGFLAMLGGLWLAISALRPSSEQAAGSGEPGAPTNITSRSRKSPRSKRSGESLSDRMEERWRRRRGPSGGACRRRRHCRVAVACSAPG